MADDEEMTDPFQEILDEINPLIRAASSALMESNHKTIMHSRRVVQQLRGFAERYNDIIDDLIVAHITAAKSISELYGDMILAENGMEEVPSDDEED